MLNDILPILPQSLDPVGIALGIAALFFGVVLWLTGGVWSRWIVTLIAVTLGGIFGLLLPRWYLWPVNAASIAVLGAVVLGVLAFIGQRVAVGIVLGAVLVAWTCFGTWIGLRGDAVFPQRQDWEIAEMQPPQYAQDFWERLPEPVRRVMPYAAASAMVSGLAITLLWPRLGRVVMGSTLGLTLFVLAAMTLMRCERPRWLIYIPPDAAVQGAVLGSMALLGILIQWQLLPTKREIQQIRDEQQETQRPIRRYGDVGAIV